MEYNGLKIKVCGMRETENIARVTALMPTYMGFVFYAKSPRYAGFVNPQTVRDLPDGVTPVAVFVNESIEHIVDICEVYGITTVQLHGSENALFCKDLVEKGFTVFKAEALTSADDMSKLEDYEGIVSMFIFDTKTAGGVNGGSGCKWDWSILDSYKLKTPYMLSGGISHDDAERIAEAMRPGMVGVDVNSRFETAPGIKDVELLSNFIKSLEYEPTKITL